ncbi:tRNA (N6-threonylcarbamoyladenosine(37)-N6)-methyltransferase TrmO [Bacteroidota bacterium]
MNEIIYKPIGIIHSPFMSVEGIPIQPSYADGIQGKVVLDKEYVEGLSDLDGFSHIILIYHFHASQGYSLKVIPFLDNSPRGLFSTRAPKRPNGIGLSVVKLIDINENILEIENIDVINGTPLLDIKPWVSRFNNIKNERNGWLDNIQSAGKNKSDDRFR